MNTNCYFIEISNCKHLCEVCGRKLQKWQQRRDLPDLKMPTFKESTWLRQYITRPQLWLRKEIYDFERNQTIVQPCTTIHVRRGDVVLHKHKSRKYRAIAEYLNVTAPVDPEFHYENNIFVLSDDGNAIGEAKALFPQFNWMYLDRPRFKASEGGWERHLPSSNPIFEVVVLLSTFRLVQRCNSLVRTNSGMGSLLEFYMKEANSTAKTIDLDRGHVRDIIFATDNNTTAAISKSYENAQQQEG